MERQELLDAAEMGERLKVSPRTIADWGRDGVIPRVEITSGVIRYDADKVMQHLQDQQDERHEEDNNGTS